MSAPDAPESWLLVEAVAERLRAITIANGYRTDAGLDVVVEYADVKDEPESPQLYVFLDGDLAPKEDTAKARTFRDYVAPVMAQAKFPISHARAQRQAHDLMSDLNRAVPPSAPRLTSDEWGLRQLSLAIVQRPRGADFVVVELVLETTFRVYNPTT